MKLYSSVWYVILLPRYLSCGDWEIVLNLNWGFEVANGRKQSNDVAFRVLYSCVHSVLSRSEWLYKTCSASRLSGDIDEVNALKTRCEQWIEPTSCTDAHTPASLLKLWYRQLCDPVIPDNMYDECVQSGFDADSSVRLVHNLPPFNRLVFSYLIRFLQVFYPNKFFKDKSFRVIHLLLNWRSLSLRTIL